MENWDYLPLDQHTASYLLEVILHLPKLRHDLDRGGLPRSLLNAGVIDHHENIMVL